MLVIDPKLILKLMAIQGVSARQLAAGIGYRSHAHVTKILRGEHTTVTPERAARIARYFGVGIDDLFVARLSTDTRRSVRSRSAA